MKAKKIKDRNHNKIIAFVYLCLDYNTKIKDKDQFINDLVHNINKTSIGYAGFSTRRSFIQHLKREILGFKNLGIIRKFALNKREILKIIEKALRKCHEVLPSEPTRVFVFPTFDQFAREKMSGIKGFCLKENVILSYISPTKRWKTVLKEMICHEFNHSVIFKYHKWRTLLDSIIFEGLAENFREDIVGGKPAPWSKALSPFRSKKIFSEMKKLKVLSSKSEKLYSSVFFENKDFPRWTGYSIGYQIVKSFLRNNEALSWKNIVELQPREILKKSKFLT